MCSTSIRPSCSTTTCCRRTSKRSDCKPDWRTDALFAATRSRQRDGCTPAPNAVCADGSGSENCGAETMTLTPTASEVLELTRFRGHLNTVQWTWLRTAYQNRKHDPRPGTRSCGASTNACPSPPSAIGLQRSAGAARVLSGTSRGDRAGLAADGEADRIGQEIGR